MRARGCSRTPTHVRPTTPTASMEIVDPSSIKAAHPRKLWILVFSVFLSDPLGLASVEPGDLLLHPSELQNTNRSGSLVPPAPPIIDDAF